MRETPLDPNRCAKTVFEGRGLHHQCLRPPMPGRACCKQHDPTMVAERMAARDAKWKLEWAEKDRRADERQRKLDSQPALLAACEELLKYPSSAPAWVLGQVQDAIKAARGKA